MKIRNRLIISNIAMLVVPIILIMLAGGIFQYMMVSQDEQNILTRHPGRLESGQVLLLSRTIAEDPRFFRDSAKMGKLSDALGWIGTIAVYSDGQLVWLTPGADRSFAETAVLKAVEAESSGITGRREIDESRGIRVAYSWDFAVPGENAASIYFLLDYHRTMSEWIVPSLGFLAIVALALFLTNGLLAWIVSRSVLRPLKQIERMALRIRDGDLSPAGNLAVAARKGSGDEFDGVMRSFDEMRMRLKLSLEAQQVMEGNRRELVASISHDLRTPLAAIKGYAEGLTDGVADTSEMRCRYLETILVKTRLMEKLIDDLFLFSRLELEGFPYEKKSLDLSLWLSDFIGELSPDFPSLAIRFVRDTEKPLHVCLDPLRMGRVVTNIVQNAATYVSRPDARMEIHVDAVNDFAVVRFSDNGHGIAAEERERIFTCHYRADVSRHREGTGLGLTIARLIAEGHGGTVRCEEASPDEGGGACFVLSLPLEEK